MSLSDFLRQGDEGLTVSDFLRQGMTVSDFLTQGKMLSECVRQGDDAE
uniref:Uncharacterized protein n=1 Tax=Trichinella nativa TaxID=6335 RepID=A0A0V1KIZ7_9BILA